MLSIPVLFDDLVAQKVDLLLARFCPVGLRSCLRDRRSILLLLPLSTHYNGFRLPVEEFEYGQV